jgi:hypothetical protein
LCCNPVDGLAGRLRHTGHSAELNASHSIPKFNAPSIRGTLISAALALPEATMPADTATVMAESLNPHPSPP